MRAVSAATRELIRAGLERVARGIVAAHGMEADVEVRAGYPVTVNHEGPAAEALEVARELAGRPEGAFAMPAPVMGAEDFSYVIERVPGAMAFLGTRPAGQRASATAPNHSNRMVLDEDALVNGVALYAASALRRLGAAPAAA